MQQDKRSAILGALSGLLPDSDVLQPGTLGYDESNSSYFAASANEVGPAIIVRPSSASQVSQIIKSPRPFLLEGHCQLAVRGTGHIPFASSANIQDGITIEMKNIKCIELIKDQSIVKLGVGETWGTVYSKLQEYGLTVAGSRQACVGVGGLILGSGLSFYSGRTGFSCDSVIEFEVVSASGDIIRASQDHNNDLWVALKGGLNNFGIVTSFTMKTFESRKIWGGYNFYQPNISTASKLWSELCDFLHDENSPTEDVYFLGTSAYTAGLCILLSQIYDITGQVDSRVLQRFTRLSALVPDDSGSSLITRVLNYLTRQFYNVLIWKMISTRLVFPLSFYAELLKTTSPGMRQVYITWTIRPDAELL